MFGFWIDNNVFLASFVSLGLTSMGLGLNSANSPMRKIQVPRKIQEYGKTKISESTSSTASRPRPIPKENPNRL